MSNPWKEIQLNDYENHMKLDSVFQFQTLNNIMKEQLCAYDAKSVMILGVAGGNGLEHIGKDDFDVVYGVDINEKYLQTCEKRHARLQGTFMPICADLLRENIELPHADLLIANLLLEYIGYENFLKTLKTVNPSYVSCVIQKNTGEAFVSDSPYIHAFDRLEEVHHRMDEDVLIRQMKAAAYKERLIHAVDTPNGKKLVRMDFVFNGFRFDLK